MYLSPRQMQALWNIISIIPYDCIQFRDYDIVLFDGSTKTFFEWCAIEEEWKMYEYVK